MDIHYPHPAQFYYEQRIKERAKRIKLKSIEAQLYVADKLKLGWTPENYRWSDKAQRDVAQLVS